MPSLLALSAPLALLLPFLGQSSAIEQDAGNLAGKQSGQSSSAPDYDTPPEGPSSPARSGASPLDAFYGGQVTRQVRIEQRVIIRISPERRSNRTSLLARLPQQGLNTRFEEREMDSCLPVNRISGVQTGTGNRLLEAEQQSEVAVDAFTFELPSGLDPFPGGRDLDENTLAGNSKVLICVDDLLGSGDCGLGIE